MIRELLVQSQRPYPLPDMNWVMSQEWHHTLFVHWPVPAASLREHIPQELEIDTFDGSAWVGIVPFQVKKTRGRFTPAIPFFSSYLEVNVRTYVKYGSRAGVYFFSLDANHLVAVLGAKAVFGLNYKQAKINFQEDDHFEMVSSRLQTADENARMELIYIPETQVFFAEPGTVEHWLTERYCLWTKRGSRLIRGDIHHTRWELQRAQAELSHEMLIPFVHQEYLTQQPLLHYSKYKKAYFWPPRLEK
ncbi:YqjF family protein [Mesobacillus sp.]|uniref:YqjF family protein n=1 Tax=Mesobacillus sp. TaxID=2675271 RepID=UPI0039F007B2